jgi:hypothetical protein
MTELQIRQKQFATYLVAGFPQMNLLGLSVKGAAAVTGNATQESLVTPVTVGKKDHGSDGILQWRLDRLTNLQQFGTEHFGDWKSLEAQAAFTLHELTNDYKVLYQELRAGVKSVTTMTFNFNNVFERSADTEELKNKRAKYAEDVLALLGDRPSLAPATTIGGTSLVAAAALVGNHVVSPMEAILYLSMLINLCLYWGVLTLRAHSPTITVEHQEIPLDPIAAILKDQEARLMKLAEAKTEASAGTTQIVNLISTLQEQVEKAQGQIK